MTYFAFYRESNNFDDILNDKNIIKRHMVKLAWTKHLVLKWQAELPENLQSYVKLMYGNDLVKLTEKDYKPILGIDYTTNR